MIQNFLIIIFVLDVDDDDDDGDDDDDEQEGEEDLFLSPLTSTQRKIVVSFVLSMSLFNIGRERKKRKETMRKRKFR